MEDSLPPGFRFHPTDEELITYYLTRKVSDFNFITRAITNVDLNKCEPWELPGKATMGEKEWYFFSLKDRKYPTGLRTNRATAAGYWKTTGKDKEIFHSGELVGMKKTLVFYKGRAPRGEKSNWVMHEYRLQSKFPYMPTKEEWVVCRVFHKSSIKKPPHSPPSPAPPIESSCDTDVICELGEIDVSNFSNLVNSSNGYNNTSSSNNYNMDMNMNMNWGFSGQAATDTPSMCWTPGFTNSNFVANSASALKALQFNQNQQQQATARLINSIVSNGDDRGGDNLSVNFPASSSKVMDPTVHLESMWRNC